MKSKIILSLLITLFLRSPLAAAEKSNWDEAVIGAAFKSLARAFVFAADIQKLKSDGLAKLKKMDEGKFRKQYTKAYPVIKELSAKIKIAYGISEEMTKEQAIKNTQSLDKQKMYEIIDAVPDRVIAGLFKEQLRKTKQKIEKSRVAGQIKEIWQKIIAKAKG